MNDTSFKTLTTSLTQLDQYQEIERAYKEYAGCQPGSELTPGALNHSEKVKDALKMAITPITKGREFTEQVYSLVKISDLVKDFAYRQTFISYASEMIPIRRDILLMVNHVEILSQERSRLDGYNPQELKSKIEGLVQSLSEMHAKIKCNLRKILEDPINKDSRCSKKFTQSLDKYYLVKHDFYLKDIETAIAQGKIIEKYNDEECWKWKGNVKAHKRHLEQLAYLAHSVHKAACILDVLAQKGADEEFWKATEKSDSEDSDLEAFLHGLLLFGL